MLFLFELCRCAAMRVAKLHLNSKTLPAREGQGCQGNDLGLQPTDARRPHSEAMKFGSRQFRQLGARTTN